MATLVQSKGATTTSSGTVAVTMDSAINENEFIVAVPVHFAPGNAHTTSVATFTEAVTDYGDSTSRIVGGIFYKVAGASESTTITATSTFTNNAANYLWVGVYTGMPTSGLLDVTQSVTDNNSFVKTKSTGTTATLAQADNLVVAAWGVGGFTHTHQYTNSFVEVGHQGDARVATKEVAATTAVECTHTWDGNNNRAVGLIAVFKSNTPVSPPVNTVPDGSTGLFMTSKSATAISGVSVADATLTSTRLYCDSGLLTVTLSGAATISAGTNGTADLTISGNQTDINATLATLTYQGDPTVTPAGFHGKDTINVVSIGTGGSDTDSFYVLNDPCTVTLTGGTHAQLVASLESVEAILDTGQTGAAFTLTTSAGANSDIDVITLTTTPVGLNDHTIYRRRRRERRSVGST